MAALDGLFPETPDDHGAHGLDEHRRLRESPGDHREDALHIRLRQIHGQALDGDEHRSALLRDLAAPVVHGGHGELRDRAVLRQEPLAHGDGLRQVEIIPVRVPVYPAAPGVQAAGEVDNDGARMLRKPTARQPVEHKRAGDDAAAHRDVAVCEGKIVVQPADDLLRFRVMDRTAPFALPGAGINDLRHRLRHAGERDLFGHEICLSFLRLKAPMKRSPAHFCAGLRPVLSVATCPAHVPIFCRSSDGQTLARKHAWLPTSE